MVTKNSIDSNIPIEISKGGTNATSFSTSSGVVKYDGTRLVSSTKMQLDSSNRMTNTAQPDFAGRLTTQQDNKTGNGAVYTIGSNALTEIYDQSGSFTTAGVYTAPISGVHYLFCAANTSGSTSDSSIEVDIITSNRSYYNLVNRLGSAAIWAQRNFCIADMDAGDTAYSTVSTSGSGADVTDIGGSTNFPTGFGGYLVC